MKITDSDITLILSRINTELARQKTRCRISVDYVLDQPRPEFLVDGMSVAYLAKRDTRKKVYNWLLTFYDGLTFIRDWMPPGCWANKNSD